MRLSDVDYTSGRLEFPHSHLTTDESAFVTYLELAERLAATLPAAASTPTSDERAHVTADFEGLRWFPLPHEVTALREA
jgi:hypothetical protein